MEVKKINTEQQAKDRAFAKIMQTGNTAQKQDAFNQIYKRYKASIFFIALRFLKNNKETADDMVQEIFMKVFDKIGRYDNSTALSTWIHAIAHNHIIDYKRKQKVEVLSVESLKADFGDDEETSEMSFQLEDKSNNTFEGVVRKERADAVNDAIENGVKSNDAKEVIRLIFMQELSYEEVAQKVNMPLGTVKALMFRAKAEMKKYLTVKSRDFEFAAA